MKGWHAVVAAGVAMLLAAAWVVHSRFRSDLVHAAARAAQGSTVLDTRCGPIEAQRAGEGLPLLMIHGSGGGHDQGMDLARPLTQYGIRHPTRVSALVLVVPITHKPGGVADSAPPVSDQKDAWLLRVLGSDFLVWSTLQFARDAFFDHVLATPPALIHAASGPEQSRDRAMAEHVLPVSARAAGLLDDTRLGKGLKAYAPTLAISARDDGLAVMRLQFKDFDSAKFDGDPRVLGVLPIGDISRTEGIAVTYWANAQNSYGGYTGLKPGVRHLALDGSGVLRFKEM